MKRADITTDNDRIADQYFNKSSQSMNEKGFIKYAKIKRNPYLKYYIDNSLQSTNFIDDSYVLYFSLTGFDDVKFQIVKWKKYNCLKSEKLGRDIVDKPNQKFQKIAFDYEEGSKNSEKVKIFVKNDFLVMERSRLYHSLHNLRTNELIINDESPWHSANADNLEARNKWSNENLRSKLNRK